MFFCIRFFDIFTVANAESLLALNVGLLFFPLFPLGFVSRSRGYTGVRVLYITVYTVYIHQTYGFVKGGT